MFKGKEWLAVQRKSAKGRCDDNQGRAEVRVDEEGEGG